MRAHLRADVQTVRFLTTHAQVPESVRTFSMTPRPAPTRWVATKVLLWEDLGVAPGGAIDLSAEAEAAGVRATLPSRDDRAAPLRVERPAPEVYEA